MPNSSANYPTVRVSVPATSANLGPGFDAFGLALELRDEVTAWRLPTGLEIEVDGEGAAALPRDERHLVIRAMRATFDRLGVPACGVGLRAVNAIPHGHGLGSSAAAICAGILSARALVTEGAQRLDDDAVLALATEIEGHPDNVAACLRGGLTVAWQRGGTTSALRLDPRTGIAPVLFVPPTTLATDTARALLPEVVPLADATHTAGRAGLLVAALTTPPSGSASLDELLLAATDERLHQRYRLPAMPESAELLASLRDQGVAAVVSGAGPSVLALVTADTAEVAMKQRTPGWRVLRLSVASVGATVSPVKQA